MSLNNNTPSANRLHIGIFGRRNSGKSTLINAITDQNTAIVSDVAGTTTDPVFKAMEIKPFGACMLIDTAGFDDIDDIGLLRVEKTESLLLKTDVAILIISNKTDNFSWEEKWIKKFTANKIPFALVVNMFDKNDISGEISDLFSVEPIIINAKEKSGTKELFDEILRLLPSEFEVPSITSHMINKDDIVVLVMPQDMSAPKGRLILPQVQTIRDLLDNNCVAITCIPESFETVISALKKPPKLIIVDSQVFKKIYELKPKESQITSFSVLFANYKGDISEFVKGAKKIDTLKETDTVLIAEACTHAPETEDIGRVKLPALLRKKVGNDLSVEVVSGTSYPEDLTKYALIIHCGGCMFNRKYVLSRIAMANSQNIPITNYGIAIAKLSGILDFIAI